MQQRQVGSTDLKIDILGLGGAPLGGNFADLAASEAGDLVAAAREAKVSYFDTAPFYGFGRSERAVGDLLRDEPCVISTKVGRILEPGAVSNPLDHGMIDPLPFHPVYDYTYDGVMRSLEHSLQRMGIDHVDILLAHDIGAFQHGAEENAKHFNNLANSGYKALDELRRTGTVKAIGLGVNENQVCLDALEIGDWDAFLLAGRYTLLEQTPLDALLPACERSNTSIICGGPFNSGVLVGREMWNYAKAPEQIVERANALRSVANQFNVSLAAAALQFPLAHQSVISVIPGARARSEFNEIWGWCHEDISLEFWAELKKRNLLAPDAPTPIENPYLA